VKIHKCNKTVNIKKMCHYLEARWHYGDVLPK